MVNINTEHRETIIRLLKESDNPVSGLELGRAAGISRVAVWKHIKALSDSGYSISSTRKGYMLSPGSGSNDIMARWEFANFAKSIHLFPVLDSTMTKAAELSFQGAGDMTIVAAEEQTAGRGTGEKRWESMAGGLYYTIILRPSLPLHYYNIANLAASCAVVSLLSSYGIKAQCVWPNDIYTENGKIAGILTELNGQPDKINFLLLGIGLNVNNNAGGISASIREITGKTVSRAKLLDDLLMIHSGFFSKRPDEITSAWRSMSNGRINKIRAKKPEGAVTGIFHNLSREGNLEIETGNGEITTLFPGDEIISKGRDL